MIDLNKTRLYHFCTILIVTLILSVKSIYIMHTWPGRRDTIWLLSIFISLFILFYFVGGGPVSSDELSYMYLAQFNSSWVSHINRYIHVYLLKIFMLLRAEPFEGISFYWSFVVATTSILIFWSSYILNQKKSYYPSFLAVLFFLSQSTVTRYVGVAYVDFTLMLWFTIAHFLLIIDFFAEGINKNKIRTAQGVVFFLAFRTKETGIVLLFLLPFFLFKSVKNKSTFSIRYLISYFIGIFVGLFINIFLNFLFLHDPLFSLNIWNSANTVGHLFTSSYVRKSGNWFSLILLSELSIPFILFLISCVTIAKEKAKHIKMIYFFPFLLLIFLSIFMSVGQWNVIPRYILPVIPAICCISTTFFYHFNIKRIYIKKSSIPYFAVFIIILLFMAILIGIALSEKESSFSFGGWTPYIFTINIYYPLIILSIISLLIFSDKQNIIFKNSISFLILLTLLPMVGATPNNITFSNRISKKHLYPIEYFKQFLNIDKETKFIVSPLLETKYEMFVGGAQAIIALSSKVNVSSQNVIKSLDVKYLNNADYVFIAASEIDKVKISKPYERIYDPTERVLLLCINKKCNKEKS